MIQPGLRIGRYEIGRRLGRGGFGVVHVARDVGLDREIAIKVLKAEYLARPQIVQRFLQEARAAARIGHAGIVTVFECGQIQDTGTVDDGNAYIAMELLVGQSLSDRLLDGGRMSAAQTITITRQLAAALAAAHAAGIVHRDLKPDNVFLVPDAAVHGGERVKILDFGVAKLMEPSDGDVNTHSQMMLGTPKYMSPEQARSAAKVDHRSDIYTLGCMMFEMLVGRGPFTGDAGDQIVAHQQQPPPSVRSIVPAVPAAIDALILRMLAKAPGDRPQSMTDVVDALADVAEEPDTQVRLQTADADRAAAEVTTIAEQAQRRAPPTRPIAIGLAGVVVLGMISFIALRDGDDDRTANVEADAAIARAEVGVDAAFVIHLPPPTTVPPSTEVSPSTKISPSIGDDVARLALQCIELRDARRWADLITCSEQLAKFDAVRGRQSYEMAHAEQRAEASDRALDSALKGGDLERAKAALAAISPDSVYRRDAETRYALAATRAVSSPDECDADALVAKGQTEFSEGVPPFGLPFFEAAYKCRPDAKTLKFAFAAACKGRNVRRARVHWKRMSQSMRDDMLSLCANNGVTVDELEL